MLKRLFDILFSISAILLFGWIVVFSLVVAAVATNSNGLFFQKRIGRYGVTFTIIKLRTLCTYTDGTISIPRVGLLLRKSKLDELPQLVNILVGHMSFVGPRPDIVGYYNSLQGEERLILQLKPGLTSEASLKYFDEEVLLQQQENPKEYNDTVIFPDKVKLNLHYYYNHSILGDIKIIYKTLLRYIQ
ncbi:lipopolysaccharide/colanic/teichoic acid biosynthesis glycosyltransferase [Flavobacterium tiangeerense]|uniref:Lipopolysaccharide/colanic/teichoic acid biosynthesis glycosyltransferase n=1 Tax=Flavobacterium tiangeerense TaxID=459471 RepID=A0ABY3FKD3_9FLAO|nr:sugar transferase [Flavobacterium tiangeerense]TWH99160.1 lipopolysaccharide/colanic/teichoic acid biosynthesis glycosyltransferase [Flavobacterium tiangeerense]